MNGVERERAERKSKGRKKLHDMNFQALLSDVDEVLWHELGT